MFEDLMASLAGLGILLYMGLAIYMKAKNLTLSDVVHEIKGGLRK